jgi:hypothetical protein
MRLLPLLLLAAPALAQEPDYLDDRSGPAAIVRSYYNAIARQEYARAWSYYGDNRSLADYPAFAAGYADTAHVEVALGEVTTEGAAGSVYGTVPIAITATATDGSTETFAGCYTTRQLQPALQDPPFRPIEILEGRLVPAEGPLDAAVPADCPAP